MVDGKGKGAEKCEVNDLTWWVKDQDERGTDEG